MRDRARKSVDMHLVLLCLHVILAPARSKCVSERLLFFTTDRLSQYHCCTTRSPVYNDRVHHPTTNLQLSGTPPDHQSTMIGYTTRLPIYNDRATLFTQQAETKTHFAHSNGACMIYQLGHLHWYAVIFMWCLRCVTYVINPLSFFLSFPSFLCCFAVVVVISCLLLLLLLLFFFLYRFYDVDDEDGEDDDKRVRNWILTSC